MISGMYMGELARRIIVKCVEQDLLFSGNLTIKMDTRDKFYTKYISEIEKLVAKKYTVNCSCYSKFF